MFQEEPRMDELQQEPEEQEAKIGMAKLFAILAGLVIICALFFSLGYSVGKKSVAGTLIPEPSPTVSTSSAPKPSPFSTRPSGEEPLVATEAPTQDGPPAGAWASKPAPEMAKGAFVVQVAAVTRQEDAEALVSALRKKDYPVFVVNNVPGDKLFHVQVGPYSDVKDAEAMKARLGRDGYNPILKK